MKKSITTKVTSEKILVNFYHGSYQYRNPIIFDIDIHFDMKDLFKEVTEKLNHSKINMRAKIEGTFWASFHRFNGKIWDEDFNIQRIKIS